MLEKTIHDEDKKNDVPIYNEIFAASISHNKVSSRDKLYELGLAGRSTHVLDLNHVAIEENLDDDEDEDDDDEEEGSSEDYSLLTQEMDNTEVLTSDIIADNDNDFHMNYSEAPHIINSDSDQRKKSNNNNNKHGKKSANEKKLENENRKRTLLSYAEVGNRLVEDINQAEEEKRTLCSDAVVVRYIEFFCSLFLYVCVRVCMSVLFEELNRIYHIFEIYLYVKVFILAKTFGICVDLKTGSLLPSTFRISFYHVSRSCYPSSFKSLPLLFAFIRSHWNY